jgi:hypothetical protein
MAGEMKAILLVGSLLALWILPSVAYRVTYLASQWAGLHLQAVLDWFIARLRAGLDRFVAWLQGRLYGS